MKAKISSTSDCFSENWKYLIFHYILSCTVIDSHLDVLKGDLNFLFVELGLGGAVNKIKWRNVLFPSPASSQGWWEQKQMSRNVLFLPQPLHSSSSSSSVLLVFTKKRNFLYTFEKIQRMKNLIWRRSFQRKFWNSKYIIVIRKSDDWNIKSKSIKGGVPCISL